MLLCFGAALAIERFSVLVLSRLSTSVLQLFSPLGEIYFIRKFQLIRLTSNVRFLYLSLT